MDNNEQYPQYDNYTNYDNYDTTGYDPSYQQYGDYQQSDNGYGQYDNTGYGQNTNGFTPYNDFGYKPPQSDPYAYHSPYSAAPQTYDPFAASAPYQKPFKRRPWVKWVVLAVVLVIAGLLTFYFSEKNGTRRAIRDLPDPVQTQAEGGTSKKVDGYDVSITYRYSYSIDALVVSTKDYDGGSHLRDQLSPVDFGLAWGNVAATNTEIDYHWSQSGRWIHWEIDTAADLAKAGGVSTVNSHCSNNHIIPATSTVESEVKKVRRGDHVKLEGYLVDVYAEKSNGTWFAWNSSTSRTDTGDGACEVFYVTKAEIVS